MDISRNKHYIHKQQILVTTSIGCNKHNIRIPQTLITMKPQPQASTTSIHHKYRPQQIPHSYTTNNIRNRHARNTDITKFEQETTKMPTDIH